MPDGVVGAAGGRGRTQPCPTCDRSRRVRARPRAQRLRERRQGDAGGEDGGAQKLTIYSTCRCRAPRGAALATVDGQARAPAGGRHGALPGRVRLARRLDGAAVAGRPPDPADAGRRSPTTPRSPASAANSAPPRYPCPLLNNAGIAHVAPQHRRRHHVRRPRAHGPRPVLPDQQPHLRAHSSPRTPTRAPRSRRSPKAAARPTSSTKAGLRRRPREQRQAVRRRRSGRIKGNKGIDGRADPVARREDRQGLRRRVLHLLADHRQRRGSRSSDVAVALPRALLAPRASARPVLRPGEGGCRPTWRTRPDHDARVGA